MLSFKNSAPPSPGPAASLSGSPSRRRTVGDQPEEDPPAAEPSRMPRFLQNMANLDKASKPFKMLDVDVSQLGKGRAALRKSADVNAPASEAEKQLKKVGFGSTFAVKEEKKGEASEVKSDVAGKESGGVGTSQSGSEAPAGAEKEAESGVGTSGSANGRLEKPKSRRTSYSSGNRKPGASEQDGASTSGPNSPSETNGSAEVGGLEEGAPMRELMVRVRRKSGEFARDEGSPSPKGLADRRKVTTPKSLDFRERLAVRRQGLSSPREMSMTPSPQTRNADRALVRRLSGSPRSAKSTDSPLGKDKEVAEVVNGAAAEGVKPDGEQSSAEGQ